MVRTKTQIKGFDILTDPFIKLNLMKMVRHAAEKNKQDVLDLQRDQMYDGLDANGQRIVPEYTPATIDIKRGKNQVTDRVTLIDTGDFYRRQYVKYMNDRLEINSRDKKTDALKGKYGEEIFGLAPKNKGLLSLFIKPDLQEIYRQHLLKK